MMWLLVGAAVVGAGADLLPERGRHRLEPQETRLTFTSGVDLVSDGEDTSSRLAFDDVLRDGRTSGVLVYAVSLRTDTKDRIVAAPWELYQLATDTGGRAIAVGDPAALASICEDIGAELRHLYRLGYSPARSVPDGRWHRVAVRVRARDARVRTRAGYYATRPAVRPSKGDLP